MVRLVKFRYPGLLNDRLLVESGWGALTTTCSASTTFEPASETRRSCRRRRTGRRSRACQGSITSFIGPRASDRATPDRYAIARTSRAPARHGGSRGRILSDRRAGRLASRGARALARQGRLPPSPGSGGRPRPRPASRVRRVRHAEPRAGGCGSVNGIVPCSADHAKPCSTCGAARKVTSAPPSGEPARSTAGTSGPTPRTYAVASHRRSREPR